MRAGAWPLTWALVAAVVGCEDNSPPAPPPEKPKLGDVAVALPSVLRPLSWKNEAGTAGVGVPSGCRLRLPVRSADLGGAEARILSSPNRLGELVIAVDEDGDGTVDRAAITGGPDGKNHPVPWSALDTPPALARGARGWMAALVPKKGADAFAVLWRSDGKAEMLASGDSLIAHDAACTGVDCAILTTLAAKVATNGASVFRGKREAPANAWQRADLRPSGKGRSVPFALVDVTVDSAGVGLMDDRFFEVWNVGVQAPTRRLRLKTGPRLYDVIGGTPTLVLHAAEPVVTPCRKHGFRLAIHGEAQTQVLTVPAPPERAVLRRTQGGVLLTWVAPASCRQPRTPLVHAAQLRPTGQVASAAMAVGYADDFAVSTEREAVDIWLRQGSRILAAHADCRVADAVPPRDEPDQGDGPNDAGAAPAAGESPRRSVQKGAHPPAARPSDGTDR